MLNIRNPDKSPRPDLRRHVRISDPYRYSVETGLNQFCNLCFSAGSRASRRMTDEEENAVLEKRIQDTDVKMSAKFKVR